VYGQIIFHLLRESEFLLSCPHVQGSSILPSTPRTSQWSLAFRFPDQRPVHNNQFSHTYTTPLWSHTSWTLCWETFLFIIFKINEMERSIRLTWRSEEAKRPKPCCWQWWLTVMAEIRLVTFSTRNNGSFSYDLLLLVCWYVTCSGLSTYYLERQVHLPSGTKSKPRSAEIHSRNIAAHSKISGSYGDECYDDSNAMVQCSIVHVDQHFRGAYCLR
jgi:hypothetical protein